MGNKSDKKSWMDGTPEFMRTVPIMFDKERNELERTKIFYRIPTTGMVVDEKTEGAIAYRRFWGYVSTPEVDFYNTVVARDAVIEAWPEYIQTGNVRLMHEAVAVGKIFEGDYEFREKGVYAGVSIPLYKADVLRDIDAGLLNGFSLGFNIDWDRIIFPENDTDPVIFNGIRIAEVTICDSPATPGCKFTEERSFMAFIKRVKGFFSRNNGQVFDASFEEGDDMDEKQLTAMMEAQRAANADMLKGFQDGFKAIVDTLKTSDATRASEVKALNDRLTNLERGQSTEEAIPEAGRNMLAQVIDEVLKDKPQEVIPFAGGLIRDKNGKTITDFTAFRNARN